MKTPTRTPTNVVGIGLTASFFPFLLNILGMDFESDQKTFDISIVHQLPKHELMDSLYYALSGSFTHSILEWSAISANWPQTMYPDSESSYG